MKIILSSKGVNSKQVFLLSITINNRKLCLHLQQKIPLASMDEAKFPVVTLLPPLLYVAPNSAVDSDDGDKFAKRNVRDADSSRGELVEKLNPWSSRFYFLSGVLRVHLHW